MQLAFAFIALFIAAAVGLLVFIFRWMVPRTMGRADDPPPHARCHTCRKPIRGCKHAYGVGSTWVHVATGHKYGPDGHIADHR